VDDDDGTLSVGDDVLAEEELGAPLISAGGVPGDEFRLDGGSGRGWSLWDMTFTKKLSALAIAGTMAITGASIATVPAVAADKAPAPATATVQSKLITGYTTSTDQWGTKLFFRKNIVPNAKGAVVIVHGAAEHSGRYDYLAKRLNDAGYSTYRFDHRGHGKRRSPAGS
jgi:hypothetical protein